MIIQEVYKQSPPEQFQQDDILAEHICAASERFSSTQYWSQILEKSSFNRDRNVKIEAF